MVSKAVLPGLILLLAHTVGAGPALGGGLKILEPQPAILPVCGSQTSPPLALTIDAGSRACGRPQQRKYKPINRGIGFEILDMESEACFVPDEAYRLLDNVVDEVRARLKQAQIRTSRLFK